jgi:Icc-related predicted phosphoesterase
MVRVLAVSDEESELAYSDHFSRLDPDVVVACGDLGSEYLEYLVTVLNKPLFFVPGNHDPERREGPEGCTNIDMRVEQAAGLRWAGLGGSHRYSPGPNQYTQEQMRTRVRRLLRRSRVNGRPRIDILITHSPPENVGDDDDPCHRGFTAFHDIVEQASPKLLIHGHIHRYGRVNQTDHRLGTTLIVNAVGYRFLEVAA